MVSTVRFFSFFMTIGNVFSMTVLRKGWDKWLLESITISKNTFFVSFFRVRDIFFTVILHLSQIRSCVLCTSARIRRKLLRGMKTAISLHKKGGTSAIQASLIALGLHFLCIRNNKDSPPVGVKTTKQQEIKNKKIYDYEDNECNPNDSCPV